MVHGAVVGVQELGLSSPKFTVVAVTSGSIGSVRFDFNGTKVSTYDESPHAMCGIGSDGKFKTCDKLIYGTNTVAATPYSKGKDAQGAQAVVTFSIVWSTSPVSSTVPLPVAPPVLPPVSSPVAVAPPITPPIPVPLPVAPPVTPPVLSPVSPPVAPPVDSPVAPLVTPPIPVPPSVAPTVLPPVSPPVAPPVDSPVAPPVTPPLCGTPKLLDGEWTNMAGTNLAYPVFLGEGQGGLIGKDFVIAGGYLESVKNATCRTYALDTTDPNATWRRMDDCQIELGVTHAATVVVGTKLYLVGGYLGGNLGTGGIGQEISDVLVYDHLAEPGKQWSRLPNLPVGRAGGGAFYDSSANALLFGAGAIRPVSGTRYAEDQIETWMYSFSNPSDGWVRKADVIFKANHMQYVTAIDANGDERHYFVGGQVGADEANGNLADMAEYDFVSNTWTRWTDMPVPRSHASSSTRAYGCGFLIISGTTNGEVRTQDISFYDPVADTWTYIGDLPNGLNTPVCVISNIADRDWVLCETGWTNNNYSRRRKIALV